MKIYFNKKIALLFSGILILASYQLLIYISPISVKDSVLYIEGGNTQRFLIKMIGLLLLYIGLINTIAILCGNSNNSHTCIFVKRLSIHF